ncbi:hypothetical protein B0H16DRAFT_184388 [Mycena metata]|uniref:Uncharacterized protein n=1 Tax=Mycena metata TaxID=1033252 RepID=A0AAD7MTZ3_9AGAR|nr:hypothetical protein B0H16DRAFT_184388 [Mycena metata]
MICSLRNPATSPAAPRIRRVAKIGFYPHHTVISTHQLLISTHQLCSLRRTIFLVIPPCPAAHFARRQKEFRSRSTPTPYPSRASPADSLPPNGPDREGVGKNSAPAAPQLRFLHAHTPVPILNYPRPPRLARTRRREERDISTPETSGRQPYTKSTCLTETRAAADENTHSLASNPGMAWFCRYGFVGVPWVRALRFKPFFSLCAWAPHAG